MRHYRRISAANWSWPPLFFNGKPLFLPISHKKSTGKIFWYWCRKRRTQSENQSSPKEKQKRCNVFLLQNGGYRTPKSSLRKIREKSRIIKFHTKNRHSVPWSWTVFVEVKIVRKLYLLFFVLLTKTFCLFKFIGSSLFCVILQCGVIFLISLLLSTFGVLWRPRSRRGSCQVG